MKTLTNEERFVALLAITEREGMHELIGYLLKSGFFKSPASTKYHGCYTGGLADHSLRVWELVSKYAEKLKLSSTRDAGQDSLPFEDSSLIIAALLHDVCKIGAYLGTKKPYKYNKANPKGHGSLSITRIEKHIKLTDIEKLLIKYHMGVYRLNEYDVKSGEYPLRGDKTLSKEERRGGSLANVWFYNPIVKLMYFCDEIATLEEKAKEGETPDQIPNQTQ